MFYKNGDLVYHTTADNPYSIIYRVGKQTAEKSFTLHSSRDMPYGRYSIPYVLYEDLQHVDNGKLKMIADQFSTIHKGGLADEYSVGDIVYILNDKNPYSLCYQLIQKCADDTFNAISSQSTPGGAHVLYGCYTSDMQSVSDKKKKLIRGQFIEIRANIEEDEEEEDVVSSIAKLLLKLGYKPCKHVYYVDKEDTPVPPLEVFDMIAVSMSRLD